MKSSRHRIIELNIYLHQLLGHNLTPLKYIFSIRAIYILHKGEKLFRLLSKLIMFLTPSFPLI